MRPSISHSAFLCLVSLGFAAPALHAAQNPPVAPPAPPAPHGAPRPPAERRDVTRSFHFEMGDGESPRILPPGTWWKDQELANRIGLTADQQKHIGDLFLQNKIQLIHMHASLEEEELLLEPLLNANPPDQGKALAQIGKIADTRAELEKANAKMLLSIRSVLSQQQWTKLQQERPAGFHFGPMPQFGPKSFDFKMPDTRAMMDRLNEQMPEIQRRVEESLRALKMADEADDAPVESTAPAVPSQP